jgi:hypothetical protein
VKNTNGKSVCKNQFGEQSANVLFANTKVKGIKKAKYKMAKEI